MSAAWQDALVVRSADGVLWLRTSSTEWPWRRRFDHTQATHDGLIVKDVDPTPVLDSEGLPIVRTVGDLTARHIGRRVRVETDRTLPDSVRLLRYIVAASEAVRLTLEVIDHPEWFLIAHFDLDTPCEVLP